MKVLVACECSGIVRDAFAELGHDAWSCDLQPSERPGQHIQGDAIAAAYGQHWDLMIAHPECTFLANSGAKHLYAGMKKENGPNPDRWARMGEAAGFFLTLWRAPIRRKCLENPIMLGHPRRLFGIPAPTQVIQPWMFGHPETKATGLWLEGCPPLEPTYQTWEQCRVALGLPDGAKPEDRVFRMAPGENRKKDRSRTFDPVAAAMARQWGADLEARMAA